MTCGQGLRYRVVLCMDHRGLHAGGCHPTAKPHIKEECLVTVPCYKPLGGFLALLLLFPNLPLPADQSPLTFLWLSLICAETLPVEAKPAWHKQAIELEEQEQEEVAVSEEPA